MKKLLIANRGEIALRVVRTAQEMGIATVVVYAEQDRESMAAQMADEAYLLSGDTYKDTYLNEDKIMEIVDRSGADAVHPGYGFLSEVPGFAQKVIDAGITWVGPSPKALVDLGDKISARRVAESAKVPPVPGLSEPVQDMRELLDFANSHGYPVMLKRADGGGGHGITVVHNDDELRRFFMNHDALQGGDLQDYFIEKFVDRARHVETQSGRDSHGNFTVYSTRDCSVQRRNQKLVEEAPAPFLPDEVTQRLVGFSQRLFDQVDYVGLGTCEFMVTPSGKVYFLEVNPRLQVEHTVSEEVSGLDLVREQLVIADGGTLTPAPAPRGHSFELRITCEDPATNLTPSSGTLEKITWPSGPGIRIDSGVEEGDTVSPKFDSMMGKVVVTAQNRAAAVARVRRALREMEIEGVPTPQTLFQKIFTNPDFTAEDHPFSVTTKWLERTYLNKTPHATVVGQPASQSGTTGPNAAERRMPSAETFVIEVDDKRVKLTMPEAMLAGMGGGAGARRGDRRPTQPLRGQGLHSADTGDRRDDGAASGVIASPMQAVVTRINVAEGQTVAKGDLLVVLESMKMENYVYAPIKGTVTKIFVSPADGVEAGETLVTLDINGGKNSKTADQPADGKNASGDSETTDTTTNPTNAQSDDAKKEDVK
ncbi:biotin carboxylase N-terminal domain-containing protein [Bifidobacterium callimiconis]|uniref:biotin carboxylase n=1 Tax=Bifidobacterium callimiconis TaxID=2306973 RepID=A0A430FE06_9BIFI|nr:biotin carboxylase N-terminal domain-containing protein [Bifidobacterium callimiconis]MBT1177792.1 ATP-grasp domain-containing protein [Bifidobacterium callimiconis]RSX50982.1 carboxylate--amine ligase [Bifidobacterium callimiconis]